MPSRVVPSGAYRNSAVNGVGSTAVKIVLDTVDTGYPYTSLTTGTVKILQPGWVTVNAQAKYTTFNITCQIRLNGNTTPVATGTTAVTSVASYRYYALAGDTLELWESDQAGSAAIITGSTNTFLHVNPEGAPTRLFDQAINRASVI